jgi:hypothetical protein
MSYRSGIPDPEAIAPPTMNDIWRVTCLETGAYIGVVSGHTAANLTRASQRAMEVYGLPVGGFRVELVRR